MLLHDSKDFFKRGSLHHFLVDLRFTSFTLVTPPRLTCNMLLNVKKKRAAEYKDIQSLFRISFLGEKVPHFMLNFPDFRERSKGIFYNI